MTKPVIRIRKKPEAYKLDPEKLKGASQSILPYLFSSFYFTEEFEYFDKIKQYLDIPEKPKTLDEITQEFDEKIDKLIEKTKRNFYASKLTAERNYEYKFDRISDNFEYAKENGNFPQKLKLTYGTGLSVSAGSYETSFIIKQGNKHEGYYTIGNQRYLKYYMPDKPNFMVRFFMNKLLGFKWIDDK
jgi:hypothetical protein